MTAPDVALDDLKRRRPEWQPWLLVVEESLRETGAPTWETAVPADVPERSAAAPLLAGATLALPMRSIRHFWQRLTQKASRSGMPRIAGLAPARYADLDIALLFPAALCQDTDRITETAMRAGADADALHALVALLPVPFLHACRRRWEPTRVQNWIESYCPVCGAWPAFAEVRGIERNRYFRCGRCSAAWYAQALSCPYCRTRTHEDLVTLVPGKSGTNAVIDACSQCLGYVKTFTTLSGCPPGAVMLQDLASVDLDVAALDHGYGRPAGAGYALTISVTETGATRRMFSWRS